MSLRDIEQILDTGDAQIIGLIRNEVRVIAPNPTRIVWAGDILVIEADPKALTSALSALGLTLEHAAQQETKAEKREDERKGIPSTASIGSSENGAKKEAGREQQNSEEIFLRELVVLPNSILSGRSATDIRLRTSFGINLLAISRQGRRSIARLRTVPIEPGDVLLM